MNSVVILVRLSVAPVTVFIGLRLKSVVVIDRSNTSLHM